MKQPATNSTAPPPSTPAPLPVPITNSTPPPPSTPAPRPPPGTNSTASTPTPQTPSGNTHFHSGYPPPSSGGGRKSPDSGWGGGGGGSIGVSQEVIVVIVIAGVVLLSLGVSIICCVRSNKRKIQSRRKADYGGEGYYVPNPLPHFGTLEDDHNYDVQPQNWQQIYFPSTEYCQTPQLPPPPPPAPFPPALPPKPPSPAPFKSRGGGSSSSIGSENLLTSLPSPGIPLGFSKSTFSYVELAMATDNFSKANILRQGDYGWTVHKGILSNGMEIAVKSVASRNGKGEREFQMEVEIIGRVHHRHLVSLVGYFITESLWLLVYEFVPNSALEFHLHEKGETTIDWPSRLRIAKGSAKGLAYLHEDCHPKIIHGHIKAANILLNHKFEAKVVDFGRAKVFSDGNTHVSTRVIGTLGYLAPEYIASGKLSEKSDVFSFGVILLELVTGRRPTDSAHTYKDDNFVDWARPLIIRFLEKNDFDALVDPRLQNNYDRNEMARMIVCATACVHTPFSQGWCWTPAGGRALEVQSQIKQAILPMQRFCNLHIVLIIFLT